MAELESQRQHYRMLAACGRDEVYLLSLSGPMVYGCHHQCLILRRGSSSELLRRRAWELRRTRMRMELATTASGAVRRSNCWRRLV